MNTDRHFVRVNSSPAAGCITETPLEHGTGGHHASPPAIFVVVPVYNEEDAVLSNTLKPLILAGYHVVVVDDGSRTPYEGYLSGMPVTVVRHPINLGQGAALQTGMVYALRHGADIIVHFDADGQHDASQIPALVHPIMQRKVDIVLGSRFLRPQDLALVPGTKKIVLRLGRWISGILTGLWLTDTHNGFRALSRQAAAAISLRENGFAHATELLGHIKDARLRYLEVPTTVRYTEYSRSKGQPISNGFNVVLDIVLRKVMR